MNGFSFFRSFILGHVPSNSICVTRIKLIVPFIIGCVLYSLPIPQGLQPKAWHLFSIFASTIIGIVLRPYPMGIMAILGLVAALLTGTLDMSTEALIGFQTPTIWLVANVFFLARGFIKSHLGSRVAYHFIHRFGHSSLGLGYALSFSEFFMAPFIPSSTARSGGLMLPIVQSICHAFHSKPELNTQGKLGSYLIQCAFHANIISSATFLTGMVSNPLCQSLAKTEGVSLTWMTWFMAAIVPGIISILSIPFLLFKLAPPEIRSSEEAPLWATEQLTKLGSLSFVEKKMMAIFALTLGLWIFAEPLHINATTTAMLGFSLAMLAGVITFEDALAEKDAWHTILWLGILIGMSKYLQIFGFVNYLTGHLSYFLAGFSGLQAFYFLTVGYFFLGYMFAGNSSHVSALYVAFLSLMISVGAPPILSALVLAFMSSLYSSLTHYGSTTGGVYFSTNFVNVRTWWAVGFAVAMVNLTIWLGLGSLWWRYLGLFVK